MWGWCNTINWRERKKIIWFVNIIIPDEIKFVIWIFHYHPCLCQAQPCVAINARQLHDNNEYTHSNAWASQRNNDDQITQCNDKILVTVVCPWTEPVTYHNNFHRKIMFNINCLNVSPLLEHFRQSSKSLTLYTTNPDTGQHSTARVTVNPMRH